MSEPDTLSVAVRIAAAPEAVFPYLTDPALLVRWIGDWAELQPVPGGLFAVDINGAPVRGRFLVVDPPHQVIFTWGAAGSDTLPVGSTTVEVNLTADGDDTVVEVIYRGLPDDELPKHRSGWDHCLARLGTAVVQTGPQDPEDRFAALADMFAGLPGVSTPGQSPRRGFGSSALKVNGSIFAMLSSGRLVVKLPRERVDTLIKSGTGGPFDAGKGRPMEEWLTVMADNDEDGNSWTALAREALAYVGSRRR